ncbi:MAG: CPBP family intramembrane metalloprotease [Clostridium sp.]|nr:CPBP family intramembrane metalloprotease [Clostridium sp.]
MLLGLVFGYIAYKTRSLWTAIIMDMINNSIATIAQFIKKMFHQQQIFL